MKVILLLCLMLAACSQNHAPSVSDNMHGLPENGAGYGDDDLSKDEEIVGPLTEDYVDATSSALEESEIPVGTHPFTTGDRVPWHMEYLMTDLSVSAGGLLGGLIMKGSPAVTFIWRKQHGGGSESALSLHSQDADVTITDASSTRDIAMQIDPAVQMAMRTGRVKSESKLRASLMTAARDFQSLAGAIGENPGHSWWVSRFRLDLTLDATGAITPAIGVGGDLRFRFEWHRIMKSSGAPAKVRVLGVKPSSLREFVSATAQDLSVLSDEQAHPDGFKAYSYRVGLGVSAKGDIGIVKSSASLIGQVYFSRDVVKPKVHTFSQELLPETINLIEDARDVHSEEHARFAGANGIEMLRVSDHGERDQIVYKVDRKKIRKGLARAAKMGLMFGRHSATATKGHWKVFELRTALDLSISGKVGLTEIAGQATSEINFYNQSF